MNGLRAEYRVEVEFQTSGFSQSRVKTWVVYRFFSGGRRPIATYRSEDPAQEVVKVLNQHVGDEYGI